jgi:hypothetical protein
MVFYLQTVPLMSDHVIQQVNTWLEEVVIGLNLCPFAAKPARLNQIHLQVFNGKSDKDLLECLQQAMLELEEKPASIRETTVIIISQYLGEFGDYNQFLDLAEGLLEQEDWNGIIQLASFHPNYQFAGTKPDDSENLTNRAPYPLLHLIREDSIESVLEKYANPESIPTNNIDRMQSLTEQDKLRLFPHLFAAKT